MKVFLQDACSAVKSMSKGAWTFTKVVLIGGGALTAAISVVALFLFSLKYYPLQTLTVIAMIALSLWFWVELDNARANREDEEEVSNYLGDKK